jgi:hypothetical protein
MDLLQDLRRADGNNAHDESPQWSPSKGDYMDLLVWAANQSTALPR